MLKNGEKKEILEHSTFDFYGVDNNMFKLGDMVFEAIEDELDGFRSYLKTITVSRRKKKGIFQRFPLAKVRVKYISDYTFNGWKFYDDTSHIWLTIGTNLKDDYYPFYVFQYTPFKKQMVSVV